MREAALGAAWNVPPEVWASVAAGETFLACVPDELIGVVLPREERDAGPPAYGLQAWASDEPGRVLGLAVLTSLPVNAARAPTRPVREASRWRHAKSPPAVGVGSVFVA